MTLFPQLLNFLFSEEGRELDVMVHSKVMVVDDVLLRVGSANLNNRSSGFDTECDLAIEGQSTDQRRKIEEIRNRLLGHHCGATEGQVSASLARTGSLIKTALELSQHGHSLQRVCDDIEHVSVLPGLEKVGDPERPIAPPALLQAFVGERPRARRIGRLFKLTVTAIVVLSLVVAWRFTSLSALANPDLVRQWLVDIAGMRAAPLIVVAVFVLGGLVGFPVLLLIAATAAAFGPWLGFTLAGAGAIASAIATYSIGAAIGRVTLERALGPRTSRVRRAIVRRGMLAVAAVRLVPIAPFTLVNLIAGASRIPFADYVLGTAIGMAPGLIIMSALGHQIWSIVRQPTVKNVVLFAMALFAWLGISAGAQALLLRWRRGAPLTAAA